MRRATRLAIQSQIEVDYASSYNLTFLPSNQGSSPRALVPTSKILARCEIRPPSIPSLSACSKTARFLGSFASGFAHTHKGIQYHAVAYLRIHPQHLAGGGLVIHRRTAERNFFRGCILITALLSLAHRLVRRYRKRYYVELTSKTAVSPRARPRLPVWNF